MLICSKTTGLLRETGVNVQRLRRGQTPLRNTIKRQVQFPPSPTGLGTMPLFQPLAGAVDLQPGAVDEDMGPFPGSR